MPIKERIGVVVSNKMDKTVVVLQEQRFKHPLYSKVMIRSKRLMAHDEQNTCSIGDRVLLEETRPLSAKKRWKLKDIISKSVST
jgi:small subunit ribosomal protein S17